MVILYHQNILAAITIKGKRCQVDQIERKIEWVRCEGECIYMYAEYRPIAAYENKKPIQITII